ncbi:Trk system potassium transporter TrkA [Selenomonadales bacterium OttesenSCG-928-I06]|nr:Trk system potassium transporter TrkA [Selenomonadales bacterium OttesenSCG-928-I06]
MHIIIIGAGKVGYSLAKRLSEESHSVVVIDQDEDRINVVKSNLDVTTILGNGASPQTLTDAGAKKSGLVIAVTISDEINMLSCLAAKKLGAKKTIARVRSEDYSKEGELVFFNDLIGVDLSINPELVTALEILRILITPGAINVEHFAEGKVQMFETKIKEDCPYSNIPLIDLTLPPQILIAGIMRSHKMIIPSGRDSLLLNDNAFFLGEDEAIHEFSQQFSSKQSKVERVLIIGAGRIGRYLAAMLQEKDISVKIIEKDPKRAQFAADKLRKSNVFCADAANIEFLKNIGIEEADVVVCVTEDDKLNLLLALISKHLKAAKTIIKLEWTDYSDLTEQLGIDVTLSPINITSGTILKLVRKGDIVQVSLLQGANAEALEFIVSEKCKHINIPLKDASFPRNALIGTIVRDGMAIVPNGDTVLMINDRVIVVVLPESVEKVISYFGKR